MEYQFIVAYKATYSDTVLSRTCHPLYGDNLAVTIDREDGEWYYKRKLEGKITFVRDDYSWIMAQPFDGTFTLTINETHDGGTSWHPYFEGTFSRANLEIDEDNQAASLSSFIEGVYNAIENGKDEDYDLMKIIPDSEAKEVQGQVHPALAMVDYRSNSISNSDMFCGSPIVAGGYKSDVETGWTDVALSGGGSNEWAAIGAWKRVQTDSKFRMIGVYAEAKVEMKEGYTDLDGFYCGTLRYVEIPVQLDVYSSYTTVAGTLRKRGSTDRLEIIFPGGYGGTMELICQPIHNNTSQGSWTLFQANGSVFSPSYIELTENAQYNQHFKKVTFYFHYIIATLLTYNIPFTVLLHPLSNILNTGNYYKGMSAFNNSDGGLHIEITTNTVEQPNGHRLIPGTGEQGTIPQYFAPPDESHDWIPLAEYGWQYASMWYTIQPSVANGLLDPDKISSFRWTRCWMIGTVLNKLLDRITDGKVVFTEDSTSSRFLYDTVNPVNQHEPFDYLITQKSNVMNPGGSEAKRCVVRLQWFLELLRNAFNCYYWLEKRNDGKYLFRVEHVEYFRNGGRYDGDINHSIDITTLNPRRNFRNQQNQLAKTYADQTNKYAYNMQNLVEKYTFSWQGDGGSDAFKGNPMFFKAGWIEKSSSEDHQVDNIFVDLAWLMLNAGSDTASSKNYDGVFLFSGYRPISTVSIENQHPDSQTMRLSPVGLTISVSLDIFLTIPQGQTVLLVRHWYAPSQGNQVIESYTGTGSTQAISIDFESDFIYPNILFLDFGANYAQVTIHRIHARTGYVYNVPNVPNLLHPSDYLQNGPLAWPWLQNEYLHYDIPAEKWSYKHDNLQDIEAANDWESGGTIKMIQKQEVNPVPITDKGTEESIMSIVGIRTSIEGGKTGIITNAKVNLTSRNAELTIIYDPVPQQQQ